MEGVGFCMIFLLTTAVSVGLHTVVEYMMDNDATGTEVSSEINHINTIMQFRLFGSQKNWFLLGVHIFL